MELNDKVGKVNTQKTLSEFVSALRKDFLENQSEWENDDLESFLDALSACADTIDAYYENTNQKIEEQNVWKLIADLLYSAKIYE